METINSIVEALAQEPCYLAIISSMTIAYFIIANNNKHSQKMEEIRFKQSLKGLK
jgi:hypothetical protein